MPAATAAPAAAAAPAEPAEEVRQTFPSSCSPEVERLTHSQEKPKEKTIFNVKLESFEATAKPKVIKEVKAMVPNLTLIEVRPSVVSGNPPKPFLLSRRRSSLSRYQRFLRRTCPRRMPKSSRRSLKVSGPSSPWSRLCLVLCLACPLPHSLRNPLPFRPTYHPLNLMHV